MKTIAALLLGCLFASSVPAATSEGPFDLGLDATHLALYEAATSPSRQFVALSGQGLVDVSPSIRMRLRILVIDLINNELSELHPMLRRWAVAWAPHDVLVVCGLTDEAYEENKEVRTIYAFVFAHGDKPVMRKASEVEATIVRAAFEKKYGCKPSP